MIKDQWCDTWPCVFHVLSEKTNPWAVFGFFAVIGLLRFSPKILGVVTQHCQQMDRQKLERQKYLDKRNRINSPVSPGDQTQSSNRKGEK